MSPVTRLLPAITLATALSAVLLGSACTTSSVSSAPDSSGSSVGSGGAGGALPSGLPPPCDPEQSPSADRACTDALAAVCATLDSEDACDQHRFPFSNNFWAVCEWADVYHFADASSCAMESQSSRCLAAVGDYSFVGYPDPFDCEVTPGHVAYWAVDDAEQSIMTTGTEPILPSTSTEHYAPCGVTIDPSMSPLCACSACAAP